MSAGPVLMVDEVPADLLTTVSAVRRGRRHSGLVIALPGNWGARALRERLAESAAALLIQGTADKPGPGLCLRLALECSGIEAPSDDPTPALAAWASASADRPLVIVEAPAAVDDLTLRAVADLAAHDRAFVVVLTSVLSDVPAPLKSLVLTGRLGARQVAALEPAEMLEHLTHVLGTVPSAALIFTAAAATGGHRALVPLFLRAAQASGILYRTQRMWHWKEDWTALRAALVDEQTNILGTLSQQTLDDLVVLALTGSLSQPDVIEMIGLARLARLRDQQLLRIEIDPSTAGRTVSIRPQLLEVLLSERITTGEAIRLWHTAGRHLTSSPNGSAMTAGAASWELRTGAGLGTARTEEAATAALRAGRFATAAELLDALPSAQCTERTMLLRARAHAGVGDVRMPLDLLAQLAHTDDPELCREAVILALRLCLFHREAATDLVAELSQRWHQLAPQAAIRSESMSVLAGYVTGVHAAADFDPEHEPLRYADAAESYICRLWEGTELAFRLWPQRGTQILMSLFDEVSVDPKGSEFIEPTVVVLVLLHAQFGWRPEVDFPRFWVQPRDLSRISSLAASQDLVHAIRDMEADRMDTCHERALEAARRTEVKDPYGLRPLSLALAAGAASYVNPDLAAQTRALATAEDSECLPFFTFIRRGLLAIGQSPSTQEASAVMASLAQEARAAGQRGQAIEMELFAILGGNIDVARTVATSSSLTTGGRDRTARLMARGLTADDPSLTLEVVRLFQDEGSEYMSSTLLAALWQRLPDLGPWRRETIRLALRARQVQTEPSWLLDTFAADLELSPRETRVLEDLRDGLSASTIGTNLGLSVRSVEGIISRLLKRFSCTNRIELLSLGLV